MAKDLTKIVKGVTDAVVVNEDLNNNADATVVNAFPLTHLGIISDDSIKVKAEKLATREAGGSEVQLGHDFEARVDSLELADTTELNALHLNEKAENNSLYLFGASQSHRIKNLGFGLELSGELSAKGKRLASVSMRSNKLDFSDMELGQIPTFYSTKKAYQYLQTVKGVRRDHLVLEVLPYLGAFQAGNELVTDGGFESANMTKGGDGSGNHVPTRITTDEVAGSYAVEVVASGAGDTGNNNVYKNSFAVTAGRKYRTSFWAKSVSGNTTLNLRFGGVTSTFTLTTSWQFFTVETTAVSSGTAYNVFYLSGEGTFRMDSLSQKLVTSTKLFGASKNRTVGTLYGSPEWGTAPSTNYAKLTFDGVDDYADFGDILDDDGVSDLLFELWVKLLGGDASASPLCLFAKKSGVGTDATAGIALWRDTTTRNARFTIADGTNFAHVVSSSTFLVANGWTHIAVSIDRNGNGQMYLNGATNGSAVAFTSVASGGNAQAFRIAREVSSNFCNIDLGALRVYNFGAGGLPSDIATIVSRHYNAEKAIFGL